MANQVAKEAIWLTKDGQPVKAGDPAAASLLVAAGLDLTDAEVEQYKVAKFMTDAQPAYDAIADHEARHGNNSPPAEALAQPEAEPVEETDDTKAATPKANKAKAPASNKSE